MSYRADLVGAGAAQVVTYNAIPDLSNAIDLGDAIAHAVTANLARA